MSITKRYVELMGETIAVESKKNVGTTVTVKLPLELVQREEPEQPEETAEEQSLEGVRVLMVEDNDLNAEIAALLLEEQNMKVTRAVDGQDAVEQFRAAADAGMNAHLSKPVNPDVFYKALREHVHVQSSLCTASVPRH